MEKKDGKKNIKFNFLQSFFPDQPQYASGNIVNRPPTAATPKKKSNEVGAQVESTQNRARI